MSDSYGYRSLERAGFCRNDPDISGSCECVECEKPLKRKTGWMRETSFGSEDYAAWCKECALEYAREWVEWYLSRNSEEDDERDGT